VKGIEPSSVAWEATALPLSYTRCAARHLLYGFGNSAAISTRQGSASTRFRRTGNGLRKSAQVEGHHSAWLRLDMHTELPSGGGTHRGGIAAND
jgi:hypothetical protein